MLEWVWIRYLVYRKIRAPFFVSAYSELNEQFHGYSVLNIDGIVHLIKSERIHLKKGSLHVVMSCIIEYGLDSDLGFDLSTACICTVAPDE